MTDAHTDTRVTRVSRHQKGKPWILLKQEMMGWQCSISWTICKSFAPHSIQITTLIYLVPTLPHHSNDRCTTRKFCLLYFCVLLWRYTSKCKGLCNSSTGENYNSSLLTHNNDFWRWLLTVADCPNPTATGIRDLLNGFAYLRKRLSVTL